MKRPTSWHQKLQEPSEFGKPKFSHLNVQGHPLFDRLNSCVSNNMYVCIMNYIIIVYIMKYIVNHLHELNPSVFLISNFNCRKLLSWSNCNAYCLHLGSCTLAWKESIIVYIETWNTKLGHWSLYSIWFRLNIGGWFYKRVLSLRLDMSNYYN